MTDDRSRLLARLRRALAPLEARAAMPAYADDELRSNTCAAAPSETSRADGVLDLVDAFTTQLASAGGRAFVEAGALGEWLLERGRVRGYCDPALLPLLRGALPSRVVVETRFVRARVDEYDFGITRAAGAIAETGSIVLNDARTSCRLAALAPWTHVAVVRRSDIHRSIADAIRALGEDPNVVWCTGPSKTADVEGILIEGVHGPGEEVALVV